MCSLAIIVEDQNFALFNYVNELNGEIEMVLKQIEQVSLRYIRIPRMGGWCTKS